MTGVQQAWLTNPDWVRKRIPGTTASYVAAIRVGWLACLFALIIGAVGLSLRGPSTWNQNRPMFFVLLIFPCIGLGLLWRNMVLAARARRFRGAYFQLDSVPFFVGGDVSGTLHVPFSSKLQSGVGLTLNCVRRTKSTMRGVTGRSKMSWDQLVWRDEKFSELSADQGLHDGTIRVAFAIPADAPTTNSANPDDRILWVLRVSAKLPGLNFIEYFELPVFSTTGMSPRPARGDPDSFSAISVSLPARPEVDHPQVIVRDAGNGTEFLFLANRHRGVALFASLAFLGWTTVIWQFFLGSDALSLSLFLLGDLLLFYWALWGWFSRGSAIFANGGIALRSSVLGIGRSKLIAYDDIRDVTSPIASAFGQGADAAPSYAIYLQTSSQGTITLATGLENSGEVGYIVNKIKDQIKAPG